MIIFQKVEAVEAILLDRWAPEHCISVNLPPTYQGHVK